MKCNSAIHYRSVVIQAILPREMDIMGYEQERPRAIPVEVGALTPADFNLRLESSLEHELVFHNGLPVTVTVVFRSGVAVEVPRSTLPNTAKGFFLVRSLWRGSRAVNVDLQRLSSDSTDDWRSECKLIQSALSELPYGDYSRRGIDYALRLDEFTHNQDSMYLSQLDIVVSIAAKDKVPFHPFSDVGMRGLILTNDDGIMGKERFQYGITIVDRQQQFGRRFINIAGEVFAIDPVDSTDLTDGVYFKTSGSVSKSKIPGKPQVLYLTFEQAKERLGLYASVEEAATLGDPKAREDKFQRELTAEAKRQEHDLLMRKRAREEELEIIRFEHEKFEARQKGLEARLRDERLLEEHKRAMEALRRKDEFEERNFWRKSTAESLKYVPAILAAVGSIVVLIVKSTGKKPT